MAMMLDQDQALGAYFLEPGRAELRHSGRTRTHFLATGGTTGGAFALIDETARCGETVPLHRHPADVESLYVIEGVLSVFLERSPCRMAAAGPSFISLLARSTASGSKATQRTTSSSQHLGMGNSTGPSPRHLMTPRIPTHQSMTTRS